MNKEKSFWRSLEEYSWKVVGRSPLPRYWRQMVVGAILMVLTASLKYARYSVVGVANTRQVVEKAATSGDYETAQRLWEEAMSELENIVYPERVVEKRIVELEQKLDEYPSNREIFLDLANLNEQLGNQDRAQEYREKARILDPNGVNF